MKYSGSNLAAESVTVNHGITIDIKIIAFKQKNSRVEGGLWYKRKVLVLEYGSKKQAKFRFKVDTGASI